MKTSKKRQPSASELVNTFEETLKNEQPSASELVNTFEKTLKKRQHLVTNSNEKPLVERLSPAGAFWRSRPAVTKPALHGFRLPGCILRCKVLL